VSSIDPGGVAGGRPPEGAAAGDEPEDAADSQPTGKAKRTRKGRTDASSRVTGVIVVGMSVAVWWPAFTIGAWGEPFFDQSLTVWAAATGAFIVVLFQPRGRPRVWRALALLIPSLWLFLSFFANEADPDDAVAVIVAVLGGLVAILALPTTIWVLARVIWPEFAEDISWPRRLAVLGSVLVIAVASFALGVNQSRFLTCEDFAISGNSEPPGCTPAPVDEP
jgi:hypothetical protein